MSNDPIQELIYRQCIEKSLIEKAGLSELSSGLQVIRDEEGWRQDEQSVEYIWIVMMSRPLVGRGGLMTVKYGEHNFRDSRHQEELVQGAFSVGPDNVIKEFYKEKSLNGSTDPVAEKFQLDLFNANKGIALDGVSYIVHVISGNIDTLVMVNNPNSSTWEKWESEIWSLGKTLASNSKSQELIELFR